MILGIAIIWLDTLSDLLGPYSSETIMRIAEIINRNYIRHAGDEYLTREQRILEQSLPYHKIIRKRIAAQIHVYIENENGEIIVNP